MPDRTYPVDYSDQDLRTELRDLSARIAAYSNAKLLDDLIKDAVRFNLGYSELQNRQVRTYSTWALGIGVASLLVALRIRVGVCAGPGQRTRRRPTGPGH